MKGHGIDFAERFWWKSNRSNGNGKEKIQKNLSQKWKNTEEIKEEYAWELLKIPLSIDKLKI